MSTQYPLTVFLESLNSAPGTVRAELCLRLEDLVKCVRQIRWAASLLSAFDSPSLSLPEPFYRVLLLAITSEFDDEAESTREASMTPSEAKQRFRERCQTRRPLVEVYIYIYIYIYIYSRCNTHSLYIIYIYMYIYIYIYIYIQGPREHPHPHTKLLETSVQDMVI